MENHIYRSQDFANEWVEQVLNEVARRARIAGDQSGVERLHSRVQRTHPWVERPAHSFCLLLAISGLYRGAHDDERGVNKDYTEQGDLFEQLSMEALAARYWRVVRVGWGKSGTREPLAVVVARVAEAVGEPAHEGAVERWTEPSAKDEGLDLIAWVHYDPRGGRPICLVQCASGANWMDKIAEPTLSKWEKLIDFTTSPRRGLTMPFAPEQDIFRRRANSDDLMLLMDRPRLLSSGPPTALPSFGLAANIVKWCTAAIAELPSLEGTQPI